MIAQYIANGLLIGSLYACLAVGFSLIYGVLNIINVMREAHRRMWEPDVGMNRFIARTR